MERESRKIELDDVSLALESWGAGDALICLHGGMGVDRSCLEVPGVLELASEDRRVVIFDQRGHGASGRGNPEDYTHERWALDVVEVARALQLGTFALLGHSYGGFIALELAVRRPELLSHLILVATSAGPVRSAVAPVKTDADMARFMEQSWPHFFAGVDEHLEVLRGLGFSADAYNAAFRRELPRYDLRQRLDTLTMPVLLVVGQEDRYHDDMRWMADRLPDARLEVLPDVGHFPFLEAPDEFRRIVDGFLG